MRLRPNGAVMYSLTCCFFAQVREYSSTHSHEALQSIHEAARCFEEWSSGEKGEPGFQQALRTKVGPRYFSVRKRKSYSRFLRASRASRKPSTGPHAPQPSQMWQADRKT